MADQLKANKEEHQNQLEQIQRRVELRSDRPFRHEYNTEHDNRARSYLIYLDQVEDFFNNNKDDDGFNTIAVMRAAIGVY